MAGRTIMSLRSAARRRRAAGLVALGLPALAAAGAVAWRAAGPGAFAAVLIAGASAMLAVIVRRTRPLDDTWVTRRLHERRRDLEDSADLLLAGPERLTDLQRLQRARIEQRLAGQALPDLREAWPWRAIALAWTLAAAIVAVALLSGRVHTGAPAAPTARTAPPPADGTPRLVEKQLHVLPPAYTGLPARVENALDATLPAGATLRWQLRFEPEPAAAELVFHDGERVALAPEEGSWIAERTLERSSLYRVVTQAETPPDQTPLHRLEVTADRPPAVRVVTPSQGVTLVVAGQRSWSVEFEASDDYGLGAARLQLTLAQGGGENVSVTERSLALRGEGDPTRRRYAYRLDLAPLGLAAGDDVIVRLSVDDNRSPVPNTARSASLILKWPPGSGEESSGLEGLVERTLPAYFRSQRQVIIDSEALLAERGRLPADRYASRSDEIGVDQRLLRLRYGQFLGEEAEDARDALPGEDGGAEEADGHAEHGPAHEEPDSSGAARDALLEQFVHTHDLPEAATLLDRETRELLRAALREMWQAELHLRQGHPERALPYEYRALDRIKQVQQASRIYLARVGLELPPIDASRRLSGDASGVRSRADALAPATTAESVPAAVWKTLGERATARDTSDGLAELEQWLRPREAELPQAIELLAAIDALRTDPACEACRDRLGSLLWPLLPVPASATTQRPGNGISGQAYLDALHRERAP